MRRILLLPALLLLAACARPVALAPMTAPVAGAEEVGNASWYGHPYHGRRTASGEVYDMNDLTAAHRTLPLGTRLMVTNLDTGQAVEVRVNDRGPFVDARVIDLSYAAARVLGVDRAGTVPVRLRVMEVGAPRTPVAVVPVSIPASPAAPAPAPSPDGLFAVQVGAFASRARAESLRETLAREGDPASVTEAEVGGDVFYRVRVGPYADRQAARGAAQRLASRGYRSVVVER